VDSARACLALCVAKPDCASWYWLSPESKVAPRNCVLNRRMSWRSPDPTATSGVIRTTPAAAPAQPRAAPAPSQPVTPATPGRTSTWEPGFVFYSGPGPYFSVEKMGTPQQCMAACVREPRCKFWFHRGKGAIGEGDCVRADSMGQRVKFDNH